MNDTENSNNKELTNDDLFYWLYADLDDLIDMDYETN